MSDLRPYQTEAVQKIEASWASGNQRVIFQCPTGSGKTRVLRTIIDDLHDRKKVVYAVAHRGNLIRQLSEELAGAEIRHGIIKAGCPQLRYRTQVCSVQTLIRRLDTLDEPELIIIDESHHSSSSTYQTILNHWPSARVLGVTATPRRMSGKPLGDTFDDLIIGPSMRFLIDEGFLSDFDYLAPDTVSAEGIPIVNGEFVQSESLIRVDNKAVIGSSVDHYRQHSDHLPAIVACVSIDHAIHVAKEFCDAGYRFRAVHSRMSEDEIYRSIRALGDGTIDGLTNCDLIGEGTDIPVVNTLIGLRMTASETIHLQYCGRVLRRCKGKDRAIILDHVGNYTRHGFPDDPREWSLDDVGAKIPDNSNYKTCPNCYHANVPVSARECPFCHFLMKETREPGARIPEQRDGVLVDVRVQRKQEIILKIARKARSLREAVLVAAADGVAEPEAEYIWNVVLRNKTA